MSPLKVYAFKQPWERDVEFLLGNCDEGARQVRHVEPLSFKVYDEGDIIANSPPTFRLSPEQCQGLVDQLWTLGFRPSDGTGSAGSLAATQKHLEDMRKLVFEK